MTYYYKSVSTFIPSIVKKLKIKKAVSETNRLSVNTILNKKVSIMNCFFGELKGIMDYGMVYIRFFTDFVLTITGTALTQHSRKETKCGFVLN